MSTLIQFDIEEERKKEKDKKKSRSTVLNKNPGSGSPSSEIQVRAPAVPFPLLIYASNVSDQLRAASSLQSGRDDDFRGQGSERRS